MGYMRVVRYADSDVCRLTVITKTCIVYIGLSAVSTTHPYPANSLAGWLAARAGAGLVGWAGLVGGVAGWRGRPRLALRDPKKNPLGD
jgi:hypothetical protein